MPRSRLAVALLVPPPLDRAVDALRLACGDPSLSRLPAHLTLVPPVNVAGRNRPNALRTLRHAARSTSPITVRLGPPATFAPVTPVLHLPVSGGDVEAVHRLRHAVFVEPLERRLDHPFVPHVTLATDVGDGRLAAAMTALADFEVDVTFERVHLLEEDEGRVWRPVADAAFRLPAVIGRGGLELSIETAERLDAEVSAWVAAAWAANGVAEYGWDSPVEEPLALVARREGDVVGAATGYVRGADAYLGELLVAAGARSQGVGAHLLARFTAEAVERGCSRVMLRCIAGGGAEAFYRRHGFVTHCPLPEWRHGRDFVQLRKDLAGPEDDDVG